MNHYDILYSTMTLVQSPMRKRTIALVAHIGSGSIGAAIVAQSKGKNPEIVYALRESVALKHSSAGAREFSSMEQSLKRIVARVYEGSRILLSHEHVSNATCIFSSPWYASHTSRIHLEHLTPVRFTHELYDSLFKKEITAIKKKLSEKEGGHEEEYELIESNIINVTLNGYPVHQPIGKKAEVVEMAIVVSFAPQKIIRAIDETIRAAVHVRSVQFHTFSLAGFAVAGDVFSGTRNLMFIEIGGEITDVVIIKKGVLLQTISFSIGSLSIISTVSKALGVLPDIARSYFAIHAENDLHQDLVAKINVAKKDARQKWVQSFREALGNFAEEIFLPRDIFVITDQALGVFFLESLQQGDFKEIAFSGGIARATLLDEHIFSPIVFYSEGVPHDAPLSLIALFDKERAEL